jgi:hypothetical protein
MPNDTLAMLMLFAASRNQFFAETPVPDNLQTVGISKKLGEAEVGALT